MRFKNNIVIITGGKSGIGKSTAELFLQEGAKVIVFDIKKPEKSCVGKNCKSIYFFKTDVTDEAQVKSMMRYIYKNFGRIDVLFNNVGLYCSKDTLSFSLCEWENMLKINLTSVFLCCKYVIPLMIRNHKGTIINMSSIDALQGEGKAMAYSATKSGIIALTKSLAKEFAKYNIRVNCVVPGPIITPLFKKWNTIKDMLLIKRNIPLGRFGIPKDVANSVLFLASEEASFITGKTIVIDGGIT